MQIYTRNGDGGQTTTRTKQIHKSDRLIHLLGSIDQLNATFGWAGVIASSYQSEITRVQRALFEIGAWLSDSAGVESVPIFVSDVTELEDEIDAMCAPPLRNFVLPGGDEFAARLQMARCSARLAEHALWGSFPHQTQVHIYINRLSDWCFALSRHALHQAGRPDVLWQSRQR